jgi:AcrR family transcriptional regulator
MALSSETAPRRKPTGRRRGDSKTREEILDASLASFSEVGYEGTSMRAVAAAAGVDHGLVRYYFQDKQAMFAETMAHRTAIPARLSDALAGDPDTIGSRLVDVYLQLWEDEATGPVLLGLFRAAVTTPHVAEMFIETLGQTIAQHTPEPIPGDARAEGFALAATHLLGVAVGLHILRLPVLRSMPRLMLVETLAPVIQHYLVGRSL